MSKAGRPPAAGFISRLVYAQRWPILGTLIRALLLLRGTNISPASLTAPGLALPHGGIGIVVHFKQRHHLPGRHGRPRRHLAGRAS
jgi:hypothetical protein